jgi:uncharacterized RDD family membrane protein YckC
VEEIVTGDAVVLDLPAARIPSRMLARAIDMLVQLVAFAIIMGIAIAATSNADDAVQAAIFVTVSVLIIIGYPVIFETLSRGQTLGKLAAGQRVVSDDGGPVRFRQALIRALAGFVECWMLIGVPALVTSLASTRGKRLGDVFSGTFVLREQAKPSPPVPWGPPLHDPVLVNWVRSLDLSALPAPLAASASGYLARYWQLDQRAREELGRQLAAQVAGRVSPPPPPGVMSTAYLSIVMSERRARDLARLAAAALPPPPPAWAGPPPWGAPPPPRSASPAWWGVAPSGGPAWGRPAPDPTAPGVRDPVSDDLGFTPPE